MTHFVIAGKPDCSNFLHAIHVASYLQDKLPNFAFTKVEKFEQDWEKWLRELNTENKWYHTSSPLIWKEVSMIGGRKYRIGGLSEFWEYVYDYYGLESTFSKSELSKLVNDSMRRFLQQQEYLDEIVQGSRKITINGASSLLACVLMYDLLNVPKLETSKGLLIKLYDEEAEKSTSKLLEVTALAEQINSEARYGERPFVTVVHSLETGIDECDLYIDLVDYSRRHLETEENWLKRCVRKMGALAEVINAFGKRTLRVVLCHSGPICFNATFLLQTVTSIRLNNIVAVTSDVGLSTMDILSKSCAVPVHQMAGPPVWGFVGINQFVDFRNIIIQAEILKPFARAVNAKSTSTLPLGTISTELRLLSYKITNDDESILEKVKERQEYIERVLKRTPVLAKVNALISLLTLWYAAVHNDHIISLGVSSNGSFGFPQGIVFSQPVVLDRRNLWIPYKCFPTAIEVTKQKIADLVKPVLELLKKYKEIIDGTGKEYYNYMELEIDSQIQENYIGCS